jgi:hypothetical protein
MRGHYLKGLLGDKQPLTILMKYSRKLYVTCYPFLNVTSDHSHDANNVGQHIVYGCITHCLCEHLV